MSQTLEKIIAKCKETGQKWTDPDFPTSGKSLSKDPNAPPESWPVVTEWKRITEFLPNPQLFIGGVEPGDVIQGCLGDCWFLGALSVVATRTDLIQQCIPQKTINEWGVYEFRFFKHGQWKSVFVDDYLPLNEGQQIFSRCKDENEVWVSLMEKAYAKLHLCYENLDGGAESYALVDMTGGAPQTFELDKKEGQTLIQSGKLWEKLMKYQKVGYLLGCAQLVSNGVAEENTGAGILQNHAYGILDVRVVNGTKLLRVRNPWGQGEWTGAWSDNSAEWTPEILAELNYKFADDGTFWMNYEDWLQQYNRFYVLRIFPANRWKWGFVESSWTKENSGGINGVGWTKYPQFTFELTQEQDVFITLMQKDTRMDGVLQSPINIGFLVLQVQDNKTKAKEMKTMVGQTVFNSNREVSKKLKLKSGKFIVIPATFHPGVESPFWLRIYSQGDSPLEVSLVPEVGGGPTTVQPVIKSSAKPVTKSGSTAKLATGTEAVRSGKPAATKAAPATKTTAKPADPKPAATKPAPKPAETKTVAKAPAATKETAKPAEPKPAAVKKTVATAPKPAVKAAHKPAEPKPVATKESKPAETKAAPVKKAAAPAPAKPKEPVKKDPAPKPAVTKEAKTAATKPAETKAAPAKKAATSPTKPKEAAKKAEVSPKKSVPAAKKTVPSPTKNTPSKEEKPAEKTEEHPKEEPKHEEPKHDEHKTEESKPAEEPSAGGPKEDIEMY